MADAFEIQNLARSVDEILILTAVGGERKHGYQIAREIEERSGGSILLGIGPGVAWFLFARRVAALERAESAHLLAGEVERRAAGGAAVLHRGSAGDLTIRERRSGCSRNSRKVAS